MTHGISHTQSKWIQTFIDFDGKIPPPEHLKVFGGAGNRTQDLIHAKDALYQLSHAPIQYIIPKGIGGQDGRICCGRYGKTSVVAAVKTKPPKVPTSSLLPKTMDSIYHRDDILHRNTKFSTNSPSTRKPSVSSVQQHISTLAKSFQQLSSVSDIHTATWLKDALQWIAQNVSNNEQKRSSAQYQDCFKEWSQLSVQLFEFSKLLYVFNISLVSSLSNILKHTTVY